MNRLGTVTSPEPWAAPRCLVIVRDEAFLTDAAHLWLDSLHVQLVSGSLEAPRLIWVFWDAALFMTNSVVQGNGDVNALGLVASYSRRGAFARGAARHCNVVLRLYK